MNWSHPVLPWIVFFQNFDAIIGPEDPIVYPEGMTNEMDYELELAVVIGKSGKFFDPDEAEDYIAGYLIFNDITARDIQREEMKPGVFCLSKGIDTFARSGRGSSRPTRSASAQPEDGAARQRRIAAGLAHGPHVGDRARDHQPLLGDGLQPGDIVSTGTVAGVAGFSEDPASLYLRPGDVVEAEIEGIGVLRNPVICWAEGHPDAAPVGSAAPAR